MATVQNSKREEAVKVTRVDTYVYSVHSDFCGFILKKPVL